jgi:hypothetical protein
MNDEVQMQLFPEVANVDSNTQLVVWMTTMNSCLASTLVAKEANAKIFELSMYRQKKSQELSTPEQILEQQRLARILSRSLHF